MTQDGAEASSVWHQLSTCQVLTFCPAQPCSGDKQWASPCFYSSQPSPSPSPCLIKTIPPTSTSTRTCLTMREKTTWSLETLWPEPSLTTSPQRPSSSGRRWRRSPGGGSSRSRSSWRRWEVILTRAGCPLRDRAGLVTPPRWASPRSRWRCWWRRSAAWTSRPKSGRCWTTPPTSGTSPPSPGPWAPSSSGWWGNPPARWSLTGRTWASTSGLATSGQAGARLARLTWLVLSWAPAPGPGVCPAVLQTPRSSTSSAGTAGGGGPRTCWGSPPGRGSGSPTSAGGSRCPTPSPPPASVNEPGSVSGLPPCFLTPASQNLAENSLRISFITPVWLRLTKYC